MSSPIEAAKPNQKFIATSGRVYLSGIDALVRLMLVQHWRDKAGTRVQRQGYVRP